MLSLAAPALVRGGSRTVYGLVRDQYRRGVMNQPDWLTDESEHFVIFYSPPDSRIAPLILDNAEEIYGPVTRVFGLKPGENVRPGEKIALMVHPDRQSLRSAFGWPEGERALGVYWGGVIRLLSPRVWVGEEEPRQIGRVFREIGPMAHELSHLVLDYRTGGNYPHWFSEGLAQWTEYSLTGYLWAETGNATESEFYPYSRLKSEFNRLPDQARAYRESFLLVSYLRDRQGSQGLERFIGRLAEGQSFDQALRQVYGINEEALEEALEEAPGEKLEGGLEESFNPAPKSAKHGRKDTHSRR